MRIWATYYSSDWSYPLTDPTTCVTIAAVPTSLPLFTLGRPDLLLDAAAACRRRVGDAQRVAGARRAAMRVAVQMVMH